MRRGFAAALALSFVVVVFMVSPWHHAQGQTGDGWTVLFDGKSLDNWSQIGDANWKLEDSSVVANQGNGFLVSKKSYGDFQLRAEFWVDDEANSGVFIRCEDPQKITGTNGYEVNIFDKRPDPSYGTGAIVNVSKVDPMPKAAGKWNTYEITAKGSHFVVVLNGVKTAEGDNADHKQGYIALQHGLGVNNNDKGIVKFRKVEMKPL